MKLLLLLEIKRKLFQKFDLKRRGKRGGDWFGSLI